MLSEEELQANEEAGVAWCSEAFFAALIAEVRGLRLAIEEIASWEDEAPARGERRLAQTLSWKGRTRAEGER